MCLMRNCRLRPPSTRLRIVRTVASLIGPVFVMARPALAQDQQNPCDRPIAVATESAQFPMIGVRAGSPIRIGAYAWLASLLRTRGNPVQARRNNTYAGLELQVQRFLGVRGSMFWPVASSDARKFAGLSVVFGF